jgi:hypothetical protein
MVIGPNKADKNSEQKSDDDEEDANSEENRVLAQKRIDFNHQEKVVN